MNERVKISTRALCLSVFSCAILIWSITSLFNTLSQCMYWENNFKELSAHNQLMLRDTTWMRWQAPENADQHMVSWIFQQDPEVIVRLTHELNESDGIRRSFINIQHSDTHQSKILETLKDPPFGYILIRNVSSVNGITEIKIEWYRDNKLPVNSKILPIDPWVILSLESILILDGKSWSIKLNNEWLNKESCSFFKGIDIIKVNENDVILKVRTPTGPRLITLKCGSKFKCQYFH